MCVQKKTQAVLIIPLSKTLESYFIKLWSFTVQVWANNSRAFFGLSHFCFFFLDYLTDRVLDIFVYTFISYKFVRCFVV